ncbi:beclin 1-associated autophagy-related key regulator-like [Mytilus galloprovincialis]|uniref:beclin 1-associated autophagy-related key regulator-like n=1 Tax=Mytilus galloprovincialis TaxID=29158 RepID=UPI003F7CA508
MESSGTESENLAPTEFLCTSSIESSTGLTVAVERCPLCDGTRRKYYCQSCVKQGLFIHSKATVCQRYTELLYKLDFTKIERDKTLEKCQEKVEPILQTDIRLQEINECHRKIDLLKIALQTAKEKIVKDKQQLENMRRINSNKSVKSKTHKEKKILIQKFIKQKYQDISDKNENIKFQVNTLADIRLFHIAVLQKYIFSVEEVTLPSALEANMAVSTVSAIRDASHMTYISGKWAYTNSLEDGNYRIIVPTLPSSGDYSSYNLWVATSRENGGNPDNSLQNPGHTISGGLSLTSQLLAVLSYILDVNLPWKQNYSVFCGGEMTEKHFKNDVARLNQNILYLCFSQGVQEYHQLDTKNTLQNILYLLQCPTFGRSIPVLINEELLHSFEEVTVTEECKSLANHDNDQDGEWEQVNEDLADMEIPSRAFYSMTSDVPSMMYTGRQSESAIGIVSSAAASVFSIFKSNKR